MRPNLLGWSPVHLFLTLLTLGEKVDFKGDDAAFWGKSRFWFDLLFECNFTIGPCTVQRVVSAAFPCGIRLWNASFSVCNYSKPYLNSIKEHTIINVDCTNEISAITSVPLFVFLSWVSICYWVSVLQFAWGLSGLLVSGDFWIVFCKRLFLVSPAMCEKSDFCIGTFIRMRIVCCSAYCINMYCMLKQVYH